MKRQSRQFIVLLALLLVVVVAFFGVMQYNKIQKDNPASTAAERIIDINRDDIIRFSYDYMGEVYTYEKVDGVWRSVDEPGIELHQNKVVAIVSRLAAVEIRQTIENVTDLSQYGLAEGYRTVSFETATESYTLYIGNFNAVTDVYYIYMPSTNTVYTIPTMLPGSIERTPEDLKNTVQQ